MKYDDRNQGGFLSDDASTRVENRFLGTVDIPFKTIYSEGRVENLLRLRTPAVNVGYEPCQKVGSSSDLVRVVNNEYGSDREILESVGNPPSQIEDRKTVVASRVLLPPMELSSRLKTEADCGTYIRILAILDPPFPKPEIRKTEEQLELCQESEMLQIHARDWLKSLQVGKEAGYLSSIICGKKRGTTMSSSTHVDHPLRCEIDLPPPASFCPLSFILF